MNEDKVLFEDIEEESRKVISMTVKDFLKTKAYNSKDVDFMINYLQDKILSELKQISDNFKYILSVIIVQNDNSGFIQNTSLYYDPETDGCISEKYTFPNISCIITLFCLAI